MKEFDSNEQISAFVDGELQGLARARVVDALYGSSELRRAWARFHLIGDAARKIGPVPGAGFIAGKVSEALSGEQIVAFKLPRRRPGIAPLSGLALAASVSAIAILGIRSLDDGGAQSLRGAGAVRPEIAASSSVSTTPDPAESYTAAAAAQRPHPEADSLQWSDVAPVAEARLNAYLVNHNEYASNGVRGVLPYVRIVGYQSVAGAYR